MKRWLCLILTAALALCCTACGGEPASAADSGGNVSNNNQDNTVPKYAACTKEKMLSLDDVISLYEEFLRGQTFAREKSGNKVAIQEYLPSGSQYSQYAVYDMNGDATPELLIKSDRGLTIFWVAEERLTVWYNGTPYCKPLNNRAVLSERKGGAPEHTDYEYILLDYAGNEAMHISFSEYVGIDDPAYAERWGDAPVYLINEQPVSKDLYDSLCKTPILSKPDDAIAWKVIPGIKG